MYIIFLSRPCPEKLALVSLGLYDMSNYYKDSDIFFIVFSNRPYCKVFHLTNKGRRHQQLVWSMEGFSAIAKAKKEMQPYNPLDMKYRVCKPEIDELRFLLNGALFFVNNVLCILY